MRGSISASLFSPEMLPQVEVTRSIESKSECYIARSCVAIIPNDTMSMVIDDLQDAIWGVDGLDL